jgi:hypothetical protein
MRTRSIEEVKEILDRYLKALKLGVATKMILDYEDETPGIEVDEWIVLYFETEYGVWAIDVAHYFPGTYDEPPDTDVTCAATFDPNEWDKAIIKVVDIYTTNVEEGFWQGESLAEMYEEEKLLEGEAE